VAEGRIKSAAHMETAGRSATSSGQNPQDAVALWNIHWRRRRGFRRDRCEAVFLFALKDQEVIFGWCQLLAQSRHSDCRNECPLLRVKRTSQIAAAMSAYDPNRT
jgi:hypothetical protein